MAFQNDNAINDIFRITTCRWPIFIFCLVCSFTEHRFITNIFLLFKRHVLLTVLCFLFVCLHVIPNLGLKTLVFFYPQPTNFQNIIIPLPSIEKDLSFQCQWVKKDTNIVTLKCLEYFFQLELPFLCHLLQSSGDISGTLLLSVFTNNLGIGVN